MYIGLLHREDQNDARQRHQLRCEQPAVRNLSVPMRLLPLVQHQPLLRRLDRVLGHQHGQPDINGLNLCPASSHTRDCRLRDVSVHERQLRRRVRDNLLEEHARHLHFRHHLDRNGLAHNWPLVQQVRIVQQKRLI